MEKRKAILRGMGSCTSEMSLMIGAGGHQYLFLWMIHFIDE